ncbi:glycosyltransferase [Prevotella sp. CAG:1185]|nr:glycosyltransferase [Prevotella sp. CAG:1185]
MTLISIIIPVYNSENTINRCVDSILNQTFRNWELLLIDDGSTDRSGDICDQYAAIDSRIKVFHKENGGVSSARNVGLDNVSGTWVTFSDCDDEILNDAFDLYDRIIKKHNNIDLICCGYIICNKSGCLKNISCDKYIISEDKEANLLKCEESVYYGFLWNKVFRVSIARKYRFDETLSWCEDHLYTYRYLLQCKYVYFSPEIVYKYYVNDTEFKGKGHGLSNKWLDYKMIITVANIERDLKYKFYKGNKDLKLVIEGTFTYKIMEAIYYSCISLNFVDAYKIYKKYYFGGRLHLLKYFVKIICRYFNAVIKNFLKV